MASAQGCDTQGLDPVVPKKKPPEGGLANASSFCGYTIPHSSNRSRITSARSLKSIQGETALRNLDFPDQWLRPALDNPLSTDAQRSVPVALSGGNDGQRPHASEYEGQADDDKHVKTGLKIFEDIEDISILAAPGATYNFEDKLYQPQAETIINLLVSHAERMRYPAFRA